MLVGVLAAQRLAAQPFSRLRFVVTILTGNLKLQSSVLSLSLGQSLPSRSKTARLCSMSSFGCDARVACSYVLGKIIYLIITNNNIILPLIEIDFQSIITIPF
jgi:hypothetical protein